MSKKPPAKSKKHPSAEIDGGGGHDGTRLQLLQTAKQLFAAKGLEGTTVKEISDGAGVNVSLVSYYFNGKEGLYRACLQDFGQSRLDSAQRVLLAPSSSEEFRVRVRMFVEEMIQWMINNPECCQMVQRETDMGLPLAEDVFSNTFLEVFKTLKRFLDASQRQGFIRKDVDAQVAAAMFLGSLVQLVRNDRIGEKFFGDTLKDVKYQNKVKEQFISLFMHGLASDAG